MKVGWLTMIPYICGGIALVAWGRVSDRMNERRWNLLLACVLSTGGLVMAGLTMGTWWAMVGMSLAAMGFYGSKGPFFAMPPMFLSGTALAAGFAWINSIGNLGGFFGPWWIGVMKDATGSFSGGLYGLALLSSGIGSGMRPVPAHPRSDDRRSKNPLARARAVRRLASSRSCSRCRSWTAARAEYPERPIRMIVPFPAGGVTDVVARLTAERLTADLGQQVIVDNKAGAGGVIGTEVVAKAAPDGYTILFTTPNHTINAALRASMPFDTEKDLAPISIVGQVPMLLVSHPSLPFKDFAGFVDYARKNPGKLNVSHAGNGTLPHITMELLQVKEHMQVTNVPYRGAAPALADLVGGPGAGQARQLHDLGAVRRRQAAERARRHQREAPEADPRRADRDGDACRASRAISGWAWWRRPARRRR